MDSHTGSTPVVKLNVEPVKNEAVATELTNQNSWKWGVLCYSQHRTGLRDDVALQLPQAMSFKDTPPWEKPFWG